MMDKKVLVIDNDTLICDSIKTYFEKEGFDVKVVNDGVAGVENFKLYWPDIVLLDIVLTKKDGWQVCREIREISDRPIIFISSKSDTFDKVLGLELGADDYLVKPFDIKELSARMNAVLRRCNNESGEKTDSETIKFENLEISLQTYELKLKGEIIKVPPKELQLIYFLALNRNRVYSRNQLLDKVWGFDYLGDSRTVDVHIKRLREKLDGISDKWELKTVWGVGYKFETFE